MQIIVLGMHRAGTSAVTRLINLMGAYLGPEDQFLPATPDNPKGYWERIDVLQLHEWLLETLNADWHRVAAVEPSRIAPEVQQAFVQRARKILHGLEGNRPWVMKDPRLCLLLPLWLPLLEVPICVHVVRHPLDTARSLEKRDGFPLHFGMALWEEYTARSLSVSAGLTRFSICYEQLMDQPLATVRDLYEKLGNCGVQALHLPTDREIKAFLESDLQHHRTADNESDARWLTPEQKQLWEALRDARLADLDDATLHNPSRRVRLRDYETLLHERNTLIQRNIAFAAIQEQRAETEKQRAATEQQLIAAQVELQHKDALLKQSAADLQSIRRLFETLHYDTQLAFGSLTWRAGFAIAEIGRRLGLLRRTFMVQDHVAQIARNYQSWQRRHRSASAPGFSTGADFDENAYLAHYPDVRAAVERGDFLSGREHFDLRGREEIANGTRFSATEMALTNPLEPDPIDPEQARRDMAHWSRQPLVSIIMPVYNVEARWLEAAIDSVMQQLYPNWELCMADDGSTRAETLETLRRLDHPRCKIRFLDRNQGIAAASNAALALASGDYIAFLDHDDELTVDALYHVVKTINEQNPDLIYSDEDKLSLDGYHLEPHFKPDYSPDLSLSINYICHLSVYRRALLDQVAEGQNPVREGFEGSQDHDLLLRVLDRSDRVHHIPRVLYHWRMIPGSTAARYDSKDHAWAAGRRAIEDTLRRRGIDGEVLPGLYPGTYRVRRTLQGQPLISILIPFRDQPELLRLCLDSILDKTTYPNFELLGISNNSVNPETLALMTRYAAGDRRIRFIRYDAPFNYAAINNVAAAQAGGEHLLLLNNDITVITPDWLETLLEHSQRPEVGVVGAKLYYPEDTVQHGGVIIGIGGIAGHAHKHAQRDQPGYFSRLHLIQNLSAVTAACLMVKKSLYLQVGGLDEQHLPVAFNDVDFCLRLRERGCLNVFTPYCELYHHESKTRGYEDTPQKQRRFAEETAYMQKRHATILRAGDPYYNPNLPLDREDFGML